ncbi:MAG: hypothetical protein U0441_37710 [Polyangiaceae bacterium]
MDAALRRAYNAAYSDDLYNRYMARLEGLLGCHIPFRVAETPFFIPSELRDYLAKSANEIIDQISQDKLVARMKQAIPASLDVPRMDHLPNCVQVDFAIVQNAEGKLEGRVVELQAFPSLYALMVIQSDVMAEMLREIPGMPKDWSIYFNGHDRDSFVKHLKHAVLGGEDPESVILLELTPEEQKTYPDFIANKMLTGVDAVCATSLIKEGRRLFREIDGRKVQVKRLYNRIVFDELEVKGIELPFRYTDDLDVTWLSHPNWYWTWSKFTLPFIDHPAVPRARYLSDLKEIPEDLSKYVLKPLFSFAGSGVNVDPTRADVEAVPEAQRDKWILQEKITYHPGISMPDGTGVKAEVRMMFLRAPEEPKPRLVLNLVRLSRGKMLGVDQNKNLTWVGGTVGMWPA